VLVPAAGQLGAGTPDPAPGPEALVALAAPPEPAPPATDHANVAVPTVLSAAGLDAAVQRARTQTKRLTDAARGRVDEAPTSAEPTSGRQGAVASPQRVASIALSRPATRLFVSPRGDDANAGTESAPVRSIGRAAAMARPGTQVVVADGTYTGSVRTEVSGTPDARIAFVAATRGRAKVVGDTSEDHAWTNSGDYVDIVGFDVSGPNGDGLTTSGSFERIVDNQVHGFAGNCISTANDGYDLHDIDVIGNLAYGCGRNALDHGIYVSHPGGVVANNIAHGNAGYGIHCWHNCNALTISNNLVFDNSEGGIVVGQGDGPNNGSVAADHFVVSNNIAVENGKEGIKESGTTGPHNRFLNNILWRNGDDAVSVDTGTATGTRVEDPGFVDYRRDGTGSYRLRPGSPAIGAGVRDGAPSTDIAGTARPSSGKVDVGVYQR
jgi:hypothetical protein